MDRLLFDRGRHVEEGARRWRYAGDDLCRIAMGGELAGRLGTVRGRAARHHAGFVERWRAGSAGSGRGRDALRAPSGRGRSSRHLYRCKQRHEPGPLGQRPDRHANDRFPDRTVLVQGGSDGRYLSTGHLVYAVGTTLMALPFDLENRRSTGGAVPVVEGVMRSSGGLTGAAQVAVASNGTLAFVPASAQSSRVRVAVIDRNGK